MSTSDSYISYFTPSEMSRDTLEFILVKRQKLAAQLVDRVRNSVLTAAKYQSLLLGPRGMGKSHMVALVYHRVKALTELDGKIAIAWLAEEEWGVAALVDLYIVILNALEREYGGLQTRIDALYDIPNAERTSAADNLIRTFVGERTLFVLMENLEEIFRGIDRDEQWAFRSFLSQKPFVTILATTPSLFNGINRQQEAFFGFFQPFYLDELSAAEATELLEKLAERRGDPDLTNFLKTSTALDRVRAVHDLAGGHPRIYLLFAHLLTQTSLDELVTPFLEFLDELTPYYQERMKALSPQQRKIVEFLSDRRGAVAVKEIVARTNGLTSQTVSSQLDKLDEMGYVRKNRVGRESHYELREPLLRMVIEKKRGRGEPIRLVVDFLRRWYSRDERRTRLKNVPAHASLTRGYLEAALDLNRALLDTPDPARAGELTPDYWEAYQKKDFAYAAEIAAEIIERKGHQSTAIDWLQHGYCLEQTDDISNRERHIKALVSFNNAIELDPRNVHAWINRGITLYGMHEHIEALASFDKAIELDPEDPDTWINRGTALAKLGKYSNALENYNKAIEIDPHDTDNWFNHGTVLVNMDQYCDALVSFNKAIELDPKNMRAWFNRGVALASMGQYSNALESYDKTIELDPKNMRAWFNRGVALASMGQYSDALTSFDKGIELNPEDSDTWINRGIALASIGRYSDALESYDKAIELEPQNAHTWINRGITLYSVDENSEALKNFDKAIELKPDNPDAWINRGVALASMGQYSNALESYDKTIELDPKNMRAWFNRGVALASMGQYSDALTSFDKGIELNPENARAWFCRGITLYRMNQPSEALENYNEAIKLNPENAPTWFYRGITLYATDQYADALVNFDKVIELDPEDSDAWINRGIALASMNQYADALGSFDRIIKLDPGNVRVWFNRGVVFVKMGEYSDALVCFDKVTELDPEDPEGWINRGIALTNMHRDSDALVSFDKVIELDPENAWAWFCRGITLYGMDKPFEALESYNEAIRLKPDNPAVWFNRGEIYLSLNQWNEFAQDLYHGFDTKHTSSNQHGDTEAYCRLLLRISDGNRMEKIISLTNLYFTHNATAELGEGLIQSIPALFGPEITQIRAESWLAAWRVASEGKQDLIVPLRLLEAAVAWKPTRDNRALLALAIEERRILERLLPTHKEETQ